MLLILNDANMMPVFRL